MGKDIPKKVFIKVGSSSVSQLRAAIIDYREREKIFLLKIYRMESEIKKLKQDKKDIRAFKNVRYDKLRYRVWKLQQKLWVFRKKLAGKYVNKLYKRITHFKKQGVAIGVAKGIEKGIHKGVRIGKRVGKKEYNINLYWRGVDVGKRRERAKAKGTYNFRRKLVYKIESMARMSVVLSRLSKALRLSPTILSYLLWVSEHEYWTKRDLFAAFNDINFDGYTFCVYKCKELGLIEPLKKDSTMITWRLTYKGTVLTNKMHKYISKYFSKK